MDADDTNTTPADSLHEVAGIQKYAMQVGQVADALSKGDALTSRLIDAVHSGDSQAVQKVFAEVGVDTQVTVKTLDAIDVAQPDTAGQGATARSQAPKVRTVTVTIGIGPISISVTVTKKSS